MIRPATRDDTAAVIDLVVAAGMFSADGAWLVEGMLEDYFGGKGDEGHVCFIDDESGLAGVACYQPGIAADRVWDLTTIAVRPVLQGRGRGAAMIRHAEGDLRARGSCWSKLPLWRGTTARARSATG